MDKKALGLPILISLVIGNMIGTGIYILPASLASYGTISILSWVFTSVGAIFLALTFASLNKRFPKTGGPYTYCKEAYGKLIGFIIAYLYWTSYLASISGIAVASIGYLGFLTPVLDANHPVYDKNIALIIEITAVWLFTLINIIGVHTAGVVQLLLTIIKIAPLVIIILLGLGSIHLANILPFSTTMPSSLTAVTSAAALTFWAFIGLDAATIPAENTQGPKDVFRATFFGTLIASLIYIACTFVLMGMIPIDQLKSSQFPFAQAGTMLFGSYAALVITCCAVISGLGTMNVCILVQGQIGFAAARDHLFPRAFAKISKRDVPVRALLTSSILVTIFLISTVEPTLLKQFNNIALLAALLVLTTYFMTALSQIKFLLTSKQPLHRIILSKTFIIALLAAIYAFWMISSLNWQIIVTGLLLMTACVPIYLFTVRKYAQ